MAGYDVASRTTASVDILSLRRVHASGHIGQRIHALCCSSFVFPDAPGNRERIDQPDHQGVWWGSDEGERGVDG